MFNRINNQRLQVFKKRHYIATIKNIVNYCTALFGYKTKPLLFETENDRNTPMCIYRSLARPGRYALFHDYKMFKSIFGHLDFQGQLSYTAFLIAHEMRHYYQMRQIDSKAPREKDYLIKAWRKDDKLDWDFNKDFDILEFYKRPMELDAQLFAYCFVAETFETVVSLSYISDDYIDILEKYHIELFGETDKNIFSSAIKEAMI